MTRSQAFALCLAVCAGASVALYFAIEAVFGLIDVAKIIARAIVGG